MISYNNWSKKTKEVTNLLRQIQEKVHSIIPCAEIILYGSRARGDASEVSDWDLLILVNQPLDRNLMAKIRDRLYDLELEMDTVLSCIIRTRDDWYSPRYSILPLKQVVEREGILL